MHIKLFRKNTPTQLNGFARKLRNALVAKYQDKDPLTIKEKAIDFAALAELSHAAYLVNPSASNNGAHALAGMMLAHELSKFANFDISTDYKEFQVIQEIKLIVRKYYDPIYTPNVEMYDPDNNPDHERWYEETFGS